MMYLTYGVKASVNAFETLTSSLYSLLGMVGMNFWDCQAERVELLLRKGG